MRLALEPFVLLLVAFVGATGCTRSTARKATIIRSEGAAEIEPQQPAAPSSAMLLVCSPQGEVQFAAIAQGGRKEGVFSLTNPTDAAIDIANIRVSCECLTITLPSRTIEPGETVSGSIVLDLALDPETTGKLGIEVEGFAEGGETAFAFTVLVEIPEYGPIAGDN